MGISWPDIQTLISLTFSPIKKISSVVTLCFFSMEENSSSSLFFYRKIKVCDISARNHHDLLSFDWSIFVNYYGHVWPL